VAPELATADRAELAALLRGYSIEVTARGATAAEVCLAHLASGTEVYVAFTPRDTHHGIVDTASRLHAAGFVPVPHVTARNLASFTQLNHFLARLAGEAGVTRALVLGGDADRPTGPYHSSLQALETGLFQRHGIRRIGLACYPEAHRKVETAVLDEALAAKLDLVRGAGLEAWLVSQFCFEAAPIVRLAQRLRARGVDAPLRVGLAGPADLRRLWKYGLYCGIGNSIRALGSRVDAVANLLARRTPDPVVADLAKALRRDPGLKIAGIHVFTFGGVAGAADWANAIIDAASVPAAAAPAQGSGQTAQ
jgi:methylenetetrahydrofolate reductase (NADPH)